MLAAARTLVWQPLAWVALFGAVAACAALLARRQRITVGVDGVYVERGFTRRFLPHDAIEAVCHLRPRPAHADAWWQVELGLRSGEGLAFATSPGTQLRDGLGQDIVEALKEARGIRLQSRPLVGDEVGLQRGQRSGSEWLLAIKRLAGADAYRKACISTDRLEELCDDSGSDAAVRAASAVALEAVGGDGCERLRLAAGEYVMDSQRRALLRIADADDDDTVAEALAELEAMQTELNSAR